MDTTERPVMDEDGSGQPGILSAISNEMVRIYKDQFGRGPTKTRTRWAGPDILIVTPWTAAPATSACDGRPPAVASWLVTAEAASVPDVWRRFLGIVTDGLRSRATSRARSGTTR